MKLLIFNWLFLDIPWQDTGPYSTGDSFQSNFFYGSGLGYWFYFLLLAVIAALWIYYDSQQRKLEATAWRIGSFIAVALVLPALFYKWEVRESAVNQYFELGRQADYLMTYQEGADWRAKVEELETQMKDDFHPLTGLIEPVMFLGILGGLGGPILAVAFYITFQGQTGDGSHSPAPGQYAPPPPPAQPADPEPDKPKANAWLVLDEGGSFQLNQGETIIGRSVRNDIQISGDTTLSKSHAKIVEQNGRFRFHDLGSTNGSKVNQQRVRQPLLLEADDDIQLGDNTHLRFVTSQR
jgi:hypothetical protein